MIHWNILISSDSPHSPAAFHCSSSRGWVSRTPGWPRRTGWWQTRPRGLCWALLGHQAARGDCGIKPALIPTHLSSLSCCCCFWFPAGTALGRVAMSRWDSISPCRKANSLFTKFIFIENIRRHHVKFNWLAIHWNSVYLLVNGLWACPSNLSISA